MRLKQSNVFCGKGATPNHMFCDYLVGQFQCWTVRLYDGRESLVRGRSQEYLFGLYGPLPSICDHPYISLYMVLCQCSCLGKTRVVGFFKGTSF